MLTRGACGFIDFGSTWRRSAAETVASVSECARRADALGFGRYWLGEHDDPYCCWHRPELMMAFLCSQTRQIRVGSGAALVMMREPAVIGYEYSQLRLLHGERIELGLGGAGGRGREVHPDVPTAVARTLPALPRGLTVWQLGSSARSLELARLHGLSLCLGMFLQQPEPSVMAACRARTESWSGRFGVALAGNLMSGDCDPTIEVLRNFDGLSEALALIARIDEELRPDNMFILDLSHDPVARLDGIQALGEALGT
ncbi:LLM class flavin-dependent oxidoreductase [Nannocystis sp. SCPEA4]|uniref:LLM class flavin-dependent oxidoreductase n=1 Tax=Nannocystis sp. SCPEA4 TaxID=2996787 RepID=UPI00226D928A|nr:LLM class flavin-dependent oxidoreductase [Nannocystis sp. SCPEA4]